MSDRRVFWIWVETKSADSAASYSVLRCRDVVIIEAVGVLYFNQLGLQHSAAIVAEIDLPTSRTLAVIEALRRDYPYVPTIILTQLATNHLLLWALHHRIWNVLTKPCSPVKLEAVIVAAERLAEQCQRGRYAIPLTAQADWRVPVYLSRKTEAALMFVAQHYQCKVTVNDAAAQCGLNVSAFSKLFKAEQGRSFRDYLLAFRLDKAKMLLLRRGVTATDVAYSVGFNDPSHFTKQFKRYVGVTPAEFSRQELH